MKAVDDARFYSALGAMTVPQVERAVAEREDVGGRTWCVMQCNRPASGMRVDGRDLCAHCFLVTVEIVSHELGQMLRAAIGR